MGSTSYETIFNVNSLFLTGTVTHTSVYLNANQKSYEATHRNGV